jgi:hypothetical protein
MAAAWSGVWSCPEQNGVGQAEHIVLNLLDEGPMLRSPELSASFLFSCRSPELHRALAAATATSDHRERTHASRVGFPSDSSPSLSCMHPVQVNSCELEVYPPWSPWLQALAQHTTHVLGPLLPWLHTYTTSAPCSTHQHH